MRLPATQSNSPKARGYGERKLPETSPPTDPAAQPPFDIIGCRVGQILVEARLPAGGDQPTEASDRIARGSERGGGILSRLEMSDVRGHPCLILGTQERQVVQMGECM
jgi:hypothetical protein